VAITRKETAGAAIKIRRKGGRFSYLQMFRTNRKINLSPLFFFVFPANSHHGVIEETWCGESPLQPSNHSFHSLGPNVSKTDAIWRPHQ